MFDNIYGFFYSAYCWEMPFHYLIIKEDHRAPVVVNQVWYKVGGSYELTGKTGLSHMLEHMMFKGTQK